MSEHRRRRRQIPDDFSTMNALAVYAGQRCIGFLVPRGKLGTEAFDASERTLGIFPDRPSAANAVTNEVMDDGHG